MSAVVSVVSGRWCVVVAGCYWYVVAGRRREWRVVVGTAG